MYCRTMRRINFMTDWRVRSKYMSTWNDEVMNERIVENLAIFWNWIGGEGSWNGFLHSMFLHAFESKEMKQSMQSI